MATDRMELRRCFLQPRMLAWLLGYHVVWTFPYLDRMNSKNRKVEIGTQGRFISMVSREELEERDFARPSFCCHPVWLICRLFPFLSQCSLESPT